MIAEVSTPKKCIKVAADTTGLDHDTGNHILGAQEPYGNKEGRFLACQVYGPPVHLKAQ
jgi:hypothetical protein